MKIMGFYCTVMVYGSILHFDGQFGVQIILVCIL